MTAKGIKVSGVDDNLFLSIKVAKGAIGAG